LSVRKQCELLDVNRTSLYYKPQAVDGLTDLLMRLIDEEYTRHPFLGTRRMLVYLRNLGHAVNRKRVQSLYELMGLEAVYPKPNLSQRNTEHKVYPYLLRGVKIERVNQVWSTDITYVRLKQGFVYLMAIIDWFSRYVLDWQISTTLEAEFCTETLSRVLSHALCEIFITDQGSQSTAKNFVDQLLERKIQVSMDGKGRALDNIFVERLWRPVKYECVYLRDFQTALEAKEQIGIYFNFYNNERPHQSLDYQTPKDLYFSS
jgi:putative transposase